MNQWECLHDADHFYLALHATYFKKKWGAITCFCLSLIGFHWPRKTDIAFLLSSLGHTHRPIFCFVDVLFCLAIGLLLSWMTCLQIVLIKMGLYLFFLGGYYLRYFAIRDQGFCSVIAYLPRYFSKCLEKNKNLTLDHILIETSSIIADQEETHWQHRRKQLQTTFENNHHSLVLHTNPIFEVPHIYVKTGWLARLETIGSVPDFNRFHGQMFQTDPYFLHQDIQLAIKQRLLFRPETLHHQSYCKLLDSFLPCSLTRIIVDYVCLFPSAQSIEMFFDVKKKQFAFVWIPQQIRQQQPWGVLAGFSEGLLLQRILEHWWKLIPCVSAPYWQKNYRHEFREISWQFLKSRNWCHRIYKTWWLGLPQGYIDEYTQMKSSEGLLFSCL